MTTHGQPARLADKPEDYAHLSLERRHIQPWEDGIRVGTDAPNLDGGTATPTWTTAPGWGSSSPPRTAPGRISPSSPSSKSTLPCPTARGW